MLASILIARVRSTLLLVAARSLGVFRVLDGNEKGQHPGIAKEVKSAVRPGQPPNIEAMPLPAASAAQASTAK